MDAHYHQVMNAINAITDTGKKLYFAYSGVLDREAFELWREQHSYQFFDLPHGEVGFAIDQDLIFDFPSRWWGGRVAGLVDKTGAQVFGRLYEIDAKHWPVVQHKEGVISGMAIEKKVKVNVGGRTVEATVFVTNPSRASTQGEISQRFIEALIQGARRSELPESYIQTLKSKAI